jgi:hypothetical protein
MSGESRGVGSVGFRGQFSIGRPSASVRGRFSRGASVGRFSRALQSGESVARPSHSSSVWSSAAARASGSPSSATGTSDLARTSEAKSKARGSASCETLTWPIAWKIESIRPGALPLPLGQHAGDRLALEVRLGAAEGAGDDREGPRPGVAGDLPLRDIAERPDHDVAPVLGEELGRHRLEATAMEEVQEEGLDDVVAVGGRGRSCRRRARGPSDRGRRAGAGCRARTGSSRPGTTRFTTL